MISFENTIEASNLTKSFGKNIAVNDVSFQLKKGEVLGFLGPNGAGKSTTMRMLTGNLAPSNGDVRICGIDIISEPKKYCEFVLLDQDKGDPQN